MTGPDAPNMSEGIRFSDGKEPDAVRTIGEVATALGIRQHVLRYWEEQFPMLRPLKRSGGRRYYRPEDLALVRRIDQLVHREGYTLRGARLVLEGNRKDAATERQADPAPPVETGRNPADRQDDASLLPRLQALRARLSSALAE